MVKTSLFDFAFDESSGRLFAVRRNDELRMYEIQDIEFKSQIAVVVMSALATARVGKRGLRTVSGTKCIRVLVGGPRERTVGVDFEGGPAPNKDERDHSKPDWQEWERALEAWIDAVQRNESTKV